MKIIQIAAIPGSNESDPHRMALTDDGRMFESVLLPRPGGWTGWYPVEAPKAPDRPRVVCLCGSTRFYDYFQEANYRETLEGRIVLSVGFYPHGPEHGEGVGVTPEQKIALDELHKRKIDLCDEVLVINAGDENGREYIGESTRSEIAYAKKIGRPVRYVYDHHEICLL